MRFTAAGGPSSVLRANGDRALMRWDAVKESVCQSCGPRIYLVRVSINNWEWVTELKRSHATWKCYANPEWSAARLH